MFLVALLVLSCNHHNMCSPAYAGVSLKRLCLQVSIPLAVMGTCWRKLLEVVHDGDLKGTNATQRYGARPSGLLKYISYMLLPTPAPPFCNMQAQLAINPPHSFQHQPNAVYM